MSELYRLYNKNRVKIWAVIISIVLVIVVIRFLSYFAIKQNNMKIESSMNNELENEQVGKEFNTMTSIVSGRELSKEQTKSISIIDLFFKYINQQSLEAAYDLLTNECKDLRYSNIKKFKELYVDRLYNGIDLDYSVENWNSNVYLVEIKNNPMVTGSFEDSSFQDYITIVSLDNGEYRLNINGYIGRDILDRKNEKDGISIELKYIDTYKDFAKYTFLVKNNSDGKMYLSEENHFDSIYLEDNKGIQYDWLSNEYSTGELTFYQGEEREIVIKYNKKYSLSNSIEKIVFDNILVAVKFDFEEDGVEYLDYSLTL